MCLCWTNFRAWLSTFHRLWGTLCTVASSYNMHLWKFLWMDASAADIVSKWMLIPWWSTTPQGSPTKVQDAATQKKKCVCKTLENHFCTVSSLSFLFHCCSPNEIKWCPFEIAASTCENSDGKSLKLRGVIAIRCHSDDKHACFHVPSLQVSCDSF